MRFPKLFFLVKKFAAAVLIVAATVGAADTAPAAEGPTLPPAEYKPLPVGTWVKYDKNEFTVLKVDGFDILVKTGTNRWLRSYGVFGKHGEGAYSRSGTGKTSFETVYDEKAKKALRDLWPLQVGKHATIKFREEINHPYTSGEYYWTVTFKVVGTEYLVLNGQTYATYVIREQGFAPEFDAAAKYFEQKYKYTKWYHPESGLVLKAVRRGKSYKLDLVEFPKGTTTHALKGTKILVEGEADKMLLAEVEKLKQEAEKAEKARDAEIARLRREAEEARKAGGSSLAAASGNVTLPPAEYKPLPVGTKVRYDNWAFTVTRNENFESVVRTDKRKWIGTYAVFGKQGNNIYTTQIPDHIWGTPSVWNNEYDDKTKSKLKGFWPLAVGKKADLEFAEYYRSDIRNWRLTLEVLRAEYLNLNGLQYPAYVVREHASSETPDLEMPGGDRAQEYVDLHWYNPDSGLVLKSDREWIRGHEEGTFGNYSLISVSFPSGTTTHALKGTKILVGGEADKALLAEVEKLKQEAEKAEKARDAEIARLRREAEEARKAGISGGDKASAAEIARLEKEVEQRHWDSVKDTQELASVQDYLKRYPQGRYVAEARARVAVLQRLASANKIDFGNYHALVIGINDYKNLPKLQMATKDAEAVARVLENDYGFRVTLLIDPVRDEILDAFDVLQETLTDKDNLLIYYAGHGWLDEEMDRGYWLPVDAKPKRRRRWISNATITDTLKGLSAKHVMVMADSCYSGTLTRAVDVGSRKRGGDYWKEMASKWARVAITSGGLEPVADKGGGENSPFAKAFIDALNDNNAVMDGTTLFTKMRRPVMVAAQQTPQYSDVRGAGHDGGDFIFVRKK